MHCTAHHLEILHFTNMRLNTCLEEEEGSWGLRICLHFYTLRILHSWHFIYSRNHVAQELHQAMHTHILACTNAANREHATSSQTLANTQNGLFLAQFHSVEELLHQSIVVLSSSLYQCIVQVFCLAHLTGRNVLYRRSATLVCPRVFLHLYQVDHRIVASTCIQRILHRHYLRAIDCAELLQHLVEIAVITVELVQHEYHWLLQALSEAELVLRANFRPLRSVDQQDSSICHVHSRHSCTYEVITTRAVDDVQFLTIVFYMEHCREYGVAIFLLYREIIADCVLGKHLATTSDDTTLIEQRLCEGGFTRARVTQERNVLDLVCLINFHDLIMI